MTYDVANQRYLATGEGCFGPGGTTSCVKGAGISDDGLHWGQATELPFPKPQRYDCHSNVFIQQYHEPNATEYVLTTRNYLDQQGRAIGITTASEFPAFPTTHAPTTIEIGTANHQLYSQITWPWQNTGLYLGIVMVFDADKPTTEGRVHCRLVWSKQLEAGWSFVDSQSSLLGPDFIPLGQSKSTCQSFSIHGNMSDCTQYQNGSRPLPHHICDPDHRQLIGGNLTLGACRRACSASPSCKFLQFEGLKDQSYSFLSGQCFLLPDCSATKEYSNPKYCIHVEGCEGKIESNDFDSHICFAAAHPLVTPGEDSLIYYMGGNGPHNGARNSSLGLARLGPDRWAGLKGSGNATTRPVLCSGKTLWLTVDVFSDEGWLKLGLKKTSTAVSVTKAIPITDNGTVVNVTFTDPSASFEGFIGTNVTLEAQLNDAMIYTYGFH